MTYEEKAKKYIQGGSFHLDYERSSYNRNYYNGIHGDLIYAESDDDNITDYYFVIDDDVHAIQFAYSLCSEGDVLHEHWQDNRAWSGGRNE